MASSVPSMDEVESALEEGVEAASKHVSHPIKWFFFFVLVFTFLFAGPVNHVMGVREKPIAPQAAETALSQPPPPPPLPVESTPQFSPPPPRSVASTPQIVPPRSTIAASTGAPRGIELDFGEHGSIRLFLRPEWCNLSATYAERVADAGGRRSTLYRLEPGFLVQGRLFGAGVPTLRKTPKAPKLMERGEVAAVLPFDPVRKEVVLIEQFRVGAWSADWAQPWLVECVAGVVEAGETPEEMVKREAREEAGCDLTALEPIAQYFSTPGACSEKVDLFCGRVDATGLGGVHGLVEEGEDIRATVWPVAEALAMLESGQIYNSMTLIALQWLARHHVTLAEKWLKDA